MAKILCLETATTNCSVAIGVDGKLVSIVEENSKQYSHSEQLHVFISKALQQAELRLQDLDAVAVSKGPGSYTGLRIGVAAAKGLCFSLDVPLIAIPTLESMAHQLNVTSEELIIPLLDARRMEVYSAVFDSSYTAIRETRAEVIDENAFQEYRTAPKLHLIGDGAEKCKAFLTRPIFEFHPAMVPSAREMVPLAHTIFERAAFEDVAYFEPFYLKDFILQGKKKA